MGLSLPELGHSATMVTSCCLGRAKAVAMATSGKTDSLALKRKPRRLDDANTKWLSEFKPEFDANAGLNTWSEEKEELTHANNV